MKPARACGFSFGVGFLGSLYAVPHNSPKTETLILASVQLSSASDFAALVVHGSSGLHFSIAHDLHYTPYCKA